MICPGTVGGRGWLPEEILESVKVKQSHAEFAKGFETPFPLRAGGGGLTWATASSADLRILVCVSGVQDCAHVVLCLGFWIVGVWFYVLYLWIFRCVQIASDRSR